MRFLQISFALLLISCTAVAQEQNTNKTFYTMQGCSYWEDLATSFSKYDEKVLFTGDIVQFHNTGKPYYGGMMFQVNQKTGTWTIISVWPDGTACVVGAGKNFEPYGK